MRLLCSRTAELRWRDIARAWHPRPRAFRGRNVWLTMNGRNAIYHALRGVPAAAGRNVLVPALHCRTLVDPVIAAGFEPSFYPVRRDFSIDIEAIDRALHDGASVLILVHFLGIPSPVRDARDVCRRYGAMLIEDCTHALFARDGDREVGETGDAAVFSFRKTLPVLDGGALIVREDVSAHDVGVSVPWLHHLKVAKRTIEHLSRPGLYREAAAPPTEAEDTEPVPEAVRPVSDSGPDSQEDSEFVDRWVVWPISWPSRLLLRSADPIGVQQTRLRNYRWLHARLSRLPGLVPCFPDPPDGASPLGYPFYREGHERIDYWVRKLGIPAFSFGADVHPCFPRGRFPDADFLSDHLALLPVHQTLRASELDDIVTRLTEAWPTA